MFELAISYLDKYTNTNTSKLKRYEDNKYVHSKSTIPNADAGRILSLRLNIEI